MTTITHYKLCGYNNHERNLPTFNFKWTNYRVYNLSNIAFLSFKYLGNLIPNKLVPRIFFVSFFTNKLISFLYGLSQSLPLTFVMVIRTCFRRDKELRGKYENTAIE